MNIRTLLKPSLLLAGLFLGLSGSAQANGGISSFSQQYSNDYYPDSHGYGYRYYDWPYSRNYRSDRLYGRRNHEGYYTERHSKQHSRRHGKRNNTPPDEHHGEHRSHYHKQRDHDKYRHRTSTDGHVGYTGLL